MKIKSDLKVRMIAGEAIVLLQSNGNSDMTKVLALNPSSKYLWDELQGKDFAADDVVDLLLQQYDVEEAKAREDALKWIDQLKELNVLE